MTISDNDLEKIKKRYFWIWVLLVLLSLAFGALSSLAFIDYTSLTGNWALAFIGIFLFVSMGFMSYLFYRRYIIIKSMVNKSNLICSWKLSNAQIEKYSEHLYQQILGKNKFLHKIVSTLLIAIFGILLLMIDEGKWFVAIVLLSLLTLTSLSAFLMPIYYKNRNKNGDGIVLIGDKGIYINGYLHNWNFPFSKLKSVKKIEVPFLGVALKYQYIDRTGNHVHNLKIPLPTNLDYQNLIKTLKKVLFSTVR